MVNFHLYPAELKKMHDYLHAAFGAITTGIAYKIAVAALDVSTKLFGRLCTRIGVPSLAERIVLPAILKDTHVAIGVAIGGPILYLLCNRGKKEIEKKISTKEELKEKEELKKKEELKEIEKKTFTKEELSLECKKILETCQNNKEKPYSKAGLEAIAFALEQLEKQPDTEPCELKNFWSKKKKNEATNPVIPRLMTLYYAAYAVKFEEALKDKDTWSMGNVVSSADDYMRMAFAISCLTLDDLEPFTNKLSSEKGNKISYANALARQDSYLYKTFYFCTLVYHWLRGRLEYGVRSKEEWGYQSEEGFQYLTTKIPEDHAKKFYDENLMMNRWRELYNEYCQRIRLYVNEEDLEKEDKRHVAWTKEDTGNSTFKREPDTLPT